jgi:hydroxypyruvate reductase
MENELREILNAGLEAADPREAVLRFLSVEGERVVAGDASFEAERVFVLSVGKAAPAMAGAAEELLGIGSPAASRLPRRATRRRSRCSRPLWLPTPQPDERSVEAARRVVEFVEPLGEGDLLIALVSGGASALLADPAPGIGLEELASLNGALLRSGASIDEINAVRKHISVLKGGGWCGSPPPRRSWRSCSRTWWATTSPPLGAVSQSPTPRPSPKYGRC